jgi:hypothetical protein
MTIAISPQARPKIRKQLRDLHFAVKLTQKKILVAASLAKKQSFSRCVQGRRICAQFFAKRVFTGRLSGKSRSWRPRLSQQRYREEKFAHCVITI